MVDRGPQAKHHFVRGKLLVLGKCNHHLVNIVQLVAKCVYIYKLVLMVEKLGHVG